MSDQKLVITSSTSVGEVTDADGRDVLITGSDLVINLIGVSGEVRVIGSGHSISAEEVEVLSIQGSNNQAQVVCLGLAKIRGEDNELEWKEALGGLMSPSFNIDGEGNAVSMNR